MDVVDENLGARFAEVRARTERLAAPLSAEDQMVQSMPDTSPTKWHRAHTTWFFAEFVLCADGTSDRVWDRPEYPSCTTATTTPSAHDTRVRTVAW